MTNADIQTLAANNPAVRRAHIRDDGTPIPLTELMAMAGSQLQSELNALMQRPSIRRSLLERDLSLTLSSGTSVTQGVRFTLDKIVASVLNITIGTGEKPLHRFKTREDFDDWYYENVGANNDTTQNAFGWTPWGRSATNKIQILIAPGTGGDTTANVHYIKKVDQPVNIESVFPDDMHYLVLDGLVNRMTGGQFQRQYEAEVQNVSRRLEPQKGGASRMKHGRTTRDFNWRQSIINSGPSSSDSPLFISRSQ